MSRGVSTVVDVVIALSLISAAAVVLVTASTPPESGGSSAAAASAADAAGSTLLSSTLTVQYRVDGDQRTVRGPAGVLLADAALAADPPSGHSTELPWAAGSTPWHVRQALRFWRGESHLVPGDPPTTATGGGGHTVADAAYVTATRTALRRLLQRTGRGVAVAAVASDGRTVRVGPSPPPQERVDLAVYRLPRGDRGTVTLYVRRWSA